MTKAPKVSLIVVSRDRAALLNRLMKALDQQDLPAFELIVVTNTGAPAARRSLRHIAFGEANIAGARNAGIRASGGDILAFCDDDCVPEPAWLSRLTAPFADARVGASGGHVLRRNGVSLQFSGAVIDASGTEIAPGPGAGLHPPTEGAALVTLGTNCAFRRSAALAAGGFDPAFRYYLDEADLNWRLARAGWWTAMVPEALVHHGLAANTARGSDRRPADLSEIAASKAVFLRKHAPEDITRHLATFRALHGSSLAEAFALGRIGGRDMALVQQTIDRGFAEGMARDIGPFEPMDEAATRFSPGVRPPLGHRIALCGGPSRLVLLQRLARRLAAQHHLVSIFCFWPGIRPLTVAFTQGGCWIHKGGSAGRVTREKRGPVGWSPRRRTEAEIARIAAQREFDIIAWSRWPRRGVNRSGLAELDGFNAEKPGKARDPALESVPSVTSTSKFRR